MRKSKLLASLAVAGAAMALGTTAMAKGPGTPARPDKTPPGLEKQLDNLAPGLLKAIAATVGSNSRLQELPVSA